MFSCSGRFFLVHFAALVSHGFLSCVFLRCFASSFAFLSFVFLSFMFLSFVFLSCVFVSCVLSSCAFPCVPLSNVHLFPWSVCLVEIHECEFIFFSYISSVMSFLVMFSCSSKKEKWFRHHREANIIGAVVREFRSHIEQTHSYYGSPITIPAASVWKNDGTNIFHRGTYEVGRGAAAKPI